MFQNFTIVSYIVPNLKISNKITFNFEHGLAPDYVNLKQFKIRKNLCYLLKISQNLEKSSNYGLL